MDNENKINQEEEENNRKHSIILLLLYILCILMFVLSGSFTLSTILQTKDLTSDKVKVGKVQMELINRDETNIKLINTYPMSEKEASLLKPFEFKVTNEGTLAVMYRLILQDVEDKDVLEKVNGGKLDHDKVSYSLIDSQTNKTIKTGPISELEEGILITEKLLPRYSKNFYFRLWINENAGNESQNKFYVGQIVLEIDEILE